MPRRVRLPGADELFRPTTVPQGTPDAPSTEVRDDTSAGDLATPSRRVKHDSKVTVYMTSDELLDVEHARLELRRDLQMTIDRGRVIREAVAIALADYDENGLDSELARRLGAS